MIQCFICHYDKDTLYPVLNVNKNTTLKELKTFFANTKKINILDLKAWTLSNTPLIYDDKSLEFYNMAYDDEFVIICMSNKWCNAVSELHPYYQ